MRCTGTLAGIEPQSAAVVVEPFLEIALIVVVVGFWAVREAWLGEFFVADGGAPPRPENSQRPALRFEAERTSTV